MSAKLLLVVVNMYSSVVFVSMNKIDITLWRAQIVEKMSVFFVSSVRICVYAHMHTQIRCG